MAAKKKELSKKQLRQKYTWDENDMMIRPPTKQEKKAVVPSPKKR